MAEATSKVMLLALSQGEVLLLRMALQELVGGRHPPLDDQSEIHRLLEKLPSSPLPRALGDSSSL